MLEPCENLVYNFVLYEHLNLLVWFETWAWIKTLWEQMLMTKPRLLCSMIWCDNVNLALFHNMVKISDDFFWENKHDMFLSGRNTYQSNMLISSTNLLHMLTCGPLSFVKLLWSLVDSFHASIIDIMYTPHIHANFHTRSYAKHDIHPPKINNPKF